MAQVKRELQENSPSAIPTQVITAISQEVTSYSGPIPHPDLLAKYDAIIPNGADRIMAMAEKQLAHRVELEKTVVLGDSRRSWWGLLLGFFATLSVCASGVIVAVNGSPTAGATIITGTIVSLAGVFVYGQMSRKSERTHKAELMAGKR